VAANRSIAPTVTVSVLVPAYNEGTRIGATVRAARAALSGCLPAGAFELIVADDGSRDETAARAAEAGACHVLRGPHAGKGQALRRAAATARGEVFLLLDADLEETAAELVHLLRPVLAGEADMTIAVFGAFGAAPGSWLLAPGKTSPVPTRSQEPGARSRSAATTGGFGLVVGLARWGVRRLTGRTLAAPLSGQRAMRRQVWERVGGPEGGFGAETGFDIDALRAGFRVLEVPTAMAHAATGRDLRGFLHRGRQFVAVARVLVRRALHPASTAPHGRPLGGTRRR
jgi:glycosyltransferase involved in cell wall biosynthesis